MYRNTGDRESMALARQFDGARTPNFIQNEPLQDFLKHLTKKECSTPFNWKKFLLSDKNFCVTFQRQELSHVIEGSTDVLDPSQISDKLIASTLCWGRYLTSPMIRTYFDPIEQLGIRIDDSAASRMYQSGEDRQTIPFISLTRKT